MMIVQGTTLIVDALCFAFYLLVAHALTNMSNSTKRTSAEHKYRNVFVMLSVILLIANSISLGMFLK